MDADRLTNDLASLKIDRDERPRRGLLKPLVYLAILGAIAALTWFVAVPALRARVFKTPVEITEVSLVSPAQASIELTSTGYVVAQRVAKVAAKTVGRISTLIAKEGDAVKMGDVIAQLDDSNARSAVATAKARVAAARARAQTARANTAEVTQQLAREDLTARQHALAETARAADAEVAAAQAEVDALEVNLRDMQVTAPMDGTVVEKISEVGELVGPQAQAILSLVDFDSLVVEIDVSESKLSLVKLGSPAEIVLDAYPGKRYRGAAMEIGKKIDRSKATVKVKVKFVDPPEGALPDMAARVSFLSKELDKEAMKEPPKLVIPQSAVVERNGEKVIFVVEEGKARLTNVQVGGTFGSAFVLAKGPIPGTKVVANPKPDLRDGQDVKESSDR
jgi:RND family efflux transporter MFP subunit